MKRKLLIVFLSIVSCLCLAFGLTACGGSSDSDGDTANNEQTSGGGSTESENPAETESLEYTLLSDNTYEVSGIGTCTDTDIVIPSTYNNLSVTSIGTSSFQNCTSITSVTISSGITSVGVNSFWNCTSLVSITLPDTITSIGACSFWNCTSLASITLPDTITSIGLYSFRDTAYYNDSNNWENGELYIGNYLIVADNSITGNYTIKDGTVVVSDSTFDSCSFESVTIPASVINIGVSLQGKSKLTDINVDTGNTMYKSIDGNLYSYDGTTLIQYALGKTESSFTVPDGVTTIGAGAFYGCSLSSITLSDGVTTIGESAFGYSLSLTDINIPDSVTTIGNQAFTNTAIKSITISSGVTFIGKTAFMDCPLLTSVTFENASGWYVTETEGAASGIKISDSSYSDTATMANCLKATYVSYYWYRSES